MGARTEWLPAEQVGLEYVETKTIPAAVDLKEEEEVNLSNTTNAVVSNQRTGSAEKPFTCSQCERHFLTKAV